MPAARLAFAILITVFFECLRPWRIGDGPVDRSDMPLLYDHIRGNIHVVEDRNYWKTNSVIYAHPDGIVIVDASWTPKTARQILWHAATLSYGDYVALILTEFSLYRTGGTAPFKAAGIHVYAQAETARNMESRWQDMQSEMSGSFSSWRWTDPVAPDRVFDRDMRLMDGRVIVIYPGPAHAPGSSIVYFPEEKILYGGSLISSPPVFLNHSNFELYESAIEQIRRLDFDTVICGHGRAVHGREILDIVVREIRAHAAARPVQ